MAKLNIDSKYRMNSGHEIPILGYGVSVQYLFPQLKIKLRRFVTYRRTNQDCYKTALGSEYTTANKIL